MCQLAQDVVVIYVADEALICLGKTYCQNNKTLFFVGKKNEENESKLCHTIVIDCVYYTCECNIRRVNSI